VNIGKEQGGKLGGLGERRSKTSGRGGQKCGVKLLGKNAGAETWGVTKKMGTREEGSGRQRVKPEGGRVQEPRTGRGAMG